MMTQKATNSQNIFQAAMDIIKKVIDDPGLIKKNLSEQDQGYFLSLLTTLNQQLDTAEEDLHKYLLVTHDFLSAVETDPEFVNIFHSNLNVEDIKIQQETRYKYIVNPPNRNIDEDDLRAIWLIGNYLTISIDAIKRSLESRKKSEKGKNVITKT
jgi:hypothetical protein